MMNDEPKPPRSWPWSEIPRGYPICRLLFRSIILDVPSIPEDGGNILFRNGIARKWNVVFTLLV